MITVDDDLRRAAAPGPPSSLLVEPVTADLSRALLADLHDWALHLESRSFTQAAVSLLLRDLRRTVPSSHGYSLRLVPAPGLADVWITAVDERLLPGGVRSCLTFDLPSCSGPGPAATATFYATAPAAFDQLGALLVQAAGDGDRVVLTGAPERPVVPGVQGLTDYTQVHRAFGVLLGRGYSSLDARGRLAALARRHGSMESAAAHLLASYDE